MLEQRERVLMKAFYGVASRFLVCVAASLFVSSAVANNYPAPKDKYVNDFAGVIHSVDQEILQQKLAELDRMRGIEGTVVTINSVSDYPTGDANIENFATHLFNTWGVGRSNTNNGFLVIIAVRDRAARIELGEAYDERYDEQVQRIMDEIMLPLLQAGDHSRAIFDGASRVATLTAEGVSWLEYHFWAIIAVTLCLIFIAAAVSLIRKGRAGWGYALLAAIFAILMWVLFINKVIALFGGGRSSGGGASGRW